MVKTNGNKLQAGKIITNHPFFTTFFWYVLTKIWNKTTVLFVYQIGLISTIWTYLCSKLRKKGNFIFLILYTIFLCFVPIIFMYSITAWKDIIYSYNLLLLGILFFIGVKNHFKYTKTELFLIILSLVWINNYRYNGIIVVFLALLTFLIIAIKKKINLKKIIAFLCCFVIVLEITKIPQKVMYKEENTASIIEDTQEKTSIGTADDINFFILTTFVENYQIDDEKDLAIINDIYPVEKIREEYDPYVVNPMSFSKNYNRKQYEKYKKEINKILIKYSIKHPKCLLKHYSYVDNMLFGLNCEKDDECYLYVYEFDNWVNKYSGDFNKMTTPILKNGYNFYLNYINNSFNSKIGKIVYMPAFSLYISIILIIIIAKKHKNMGYILCISPMIYNTISLVGINVAQDVRYVYINYLTLLMLVIPIFIFDRIKVRKIKMEKKDNKKLKTLVIIPAYNEEESIEKVVKDIYKQKIENLDVIVVNDCSKDNTYKKAKNTEAKAVIDLPNNLGIGGAVQTGYLYALKNDYDIAIQVDGDGQHDSKYLRDLINEIKKGYNLVIGSRFVKKTNYKQTFMRMLGINMISGIIKLRTGEKIYDTTSGFRAADRKIIKEFVNYYPYDYPEPCTNLSIIKKGYNVSEIPVEMKKRETGKSSISPLKSITYMTKVILYLIIQ